MAEYVLVIRSPAGAKLAEVDDYHWLGYRRVVNDPGVLKFRLDGDNKAVDLLSHNSQVEVRRRVAEHGIAWHVDFYGLFQWPKRQTTEHDVFEAVCPGQLSMLGWRHVAWAAGTANRSKFTGVAAETIMKTLVQYNATSDATVANGRKREGAVTGISIEADSARGTVRDWGCAHANLLKTLQELALVGGGDFDLIKTGAQAWEFRFYPGQRGTDRSATVLFSLGYGNMANPTYSYDRTQEATVAIVGGQGEGEDREFVIRTSADYAADNDIEIFVDAKDLTTTAGYQARGDAALEERRALEEFDFDVLQVPSVLYGKHYFLGDKVSARYGSIASTQKIEAVTIAFNRNGDEQIAVEKRSV